MKIMSSRLGYILSILLLSIVIAKANETDIKHKFDTYKDSIHISLKKSELSKATHFATEYLELVKNQFFTEDNYVAALDLLYTCYMRQNKCKETIDILKNELNWAKGKENEKLVLNVRYYQGLFFKNLNENEKAIKYFHEILEKLEDDHIDLPKEELAISKIIMFFELSEMLIHVDPKKSLSYVIDAQNISYAIEDSIFIAKSHLYKGWALIEMSQYNGVEKELDKAFEIYSLIENVTGKVMVQLERGILLEHKGQMERAKGFFLASYDLLFKDKDYKFKSYFLKQKTLESLSRVYMSLNEIDSSLAYNLEGLALAKGYKDQKAIADLANRIAKQYEFKEKNDVALAYYKLSNEKYEILHQEDARINILKKEHKHANRKVENELLNVQSSLKSKEKNIGYLVLLSTLTGILLILFLRKIRKHFKLKEETLKAKEHIIFKKNQDMVHLSLVNQSKNQFIDYLKDKLQSIYTTSEFKSPDLENLIFQLKKSVNKEEEWSRFKMYHMEMAPNFYQEIHRKWPHLTILDIRHCTLLKLNMSNAEAAEVLGISPKSVKMARYRLKKKLNYSSPMTLKAYIASI